MLSYDDCVGLSELTREEIAAIAYHLHVPEIVAVGMGARLCQTPEGGQVIRRLSGQAVEEGRDATREPLQHGGGRPKVELRHDDVPAQVPRNQLQALYKRYGVTLYRNEG